MQLTFAIQFLMVAREKTHKTRQISLASFSWLVEYACTKGWLARLVCRQGQREEIEWQRQQTPPGCYWFVAGAGGSLSYNVCATTVGLPWQQKLRGFKTKGMLPDIPIYECKALVFYPHLSHTISILLPNVPSFCV